MFNKILLRIVYETAINLLKHGYWHIKNRLTANFKMTMNFKEQTWDPMNLGFSNFYIRKNVPESFLNTDYCQIFCFTGHVTWIRNQTNLPLYHVKSSHVCFPISYKMGMMSPIHGVVVRIQSYYLKHWVDHPYMLAIKQTNQKSQYSRWCWQSALILNTVAWPQASYGLSVGYV